MTRLFRRLRRRLRVYCLACDKTAPSGPPELVLAWLDRHRCLGGHTVSCGLQAAKADWCPDCKTSAGITTMPGQLATNPQPIHAGERVGVMCPPARCPECGCPLGYRAGICDTCHTHYVSCTGPGGRH